MPNFSTEDCRQPWESDEHWALRKEFIVKYQSNFDVDRLLCLAQVYTNMELLGCSYPAPVMIQIRELAKGLKHSKELQETRKARAAVQFVKEGNDKNSSDYQHKRGTQFETPSPQKRIKVEQSDSEKNIVHSSNVTKCEPVAATGNGSSTLNPAPSNSKCKIDVERTNKLKLLRPLMRQGTAKGVDPLVALHNAAQKLAYSFKYDTESCQLDKKSAFKTSLKILDVLVGESTETSKKKSKTEAAKQAVTKLDQDNPVVDENGIVYLSDQTMHPVIKEEVEEPPVEITNETPDVNATDFPKPIDNLKYITFPLDPTLKNKFFIMDYTLVRKIISAVSTLEESAGYCKIPLQFEPSLPFGASKSAYCFDIILNNRLLCQSFGATKREAKENAAAVALDRLCRVVYTVKVKESDADAFSVPRNQIVSCPSPSSSITDDNIGCKMLKMMGWAGGGIGKKGNTGISEPIHADIYLQGEGLGYSSNTEATKIFKSRIESLLNEYAKSSCDNDLIFSSEFSKDERKEIHRIALKYHLKNGSRGSGDFRHVVISRRFGAMELIAHLKKAGGSTSKYQLIEPYEPSKLT